MVINGRFSLLPVSPSVKKKHDGGERTLRFPVAVVDPEPVIAVMRGGISAWRLVLAAVNPHRLRASVVFIVMLVAVFPSPTRYFAL
jgi:hypothetical protein